MIDPSKRALDVWPNRLCEGTVARASVICSGEHNKKRRGIDAAVVPLKRNLSQRGHFVRAYLVYHLAGLRILLRVVGVGLGSCQVRQDATCDRRIKPEALESSDDSVPAEYRAEPRNTSVRIRAVRRFRSHHVEIGERTVQPIVELFVPRKNLRLSGAHAFERTRCFLDNALVARPDVLSRITIHLACNRAAVAGIFACFQSNLKRGDRLV